jgi:hypothetical protein
VGFAWCWLVGAGWQHLLLTTSHNATDCPGNIIRGLPNSMPWCCHDVGGHGSQCVRLPTGSATGCGLEHVSSSGGHTTCRPSGSVCWDHVCSVFGTSQGVLLMFAVLMLGTTGVSGQLRCVLKRRKALCHAGGVYS